MANYITIKQLDIANGIGIRTSIFFSGCDFKCLNCFNMEAWDFNNGDRYTKEVYENDIKPTITNHIGGISILGGEPLHYRNCKCVSDLINTFKSDFPDKSIWVWSGFTLEELKNIANSKDKGHYSFFIKYVLNNIDVLVDGKFINEQRDLSLKWCGSKNQRVIDMKKSIKQNKVVLYKE